MPNFDFETTLASVSNRVDSLGGSVITIIPTSTHHGIDEGIVIWRKHDTDERVTHVYGVSDAGQAAALWFGHTGEPGGEDDYQAIARGVSRAADDLPPVN